MIRVGRNDGLGRVETGVSKMGPAGACQRRVLVCHHTNTRVYHSYLYFDTQYFIHP